MRSNGSIAAFVALVFALSVPLWIAGAVTKLMLPMQLPIAALTFLCPGVAAAMLTYRREGPEGVRRLLRRTVDRGSGTPKRWWYLVSVIIPPVLVALVRLLVLPIAGLPVPPMPAPWSALPVLLVLFFIAAAFEEAGWMGYAADPLQQRFGALLSGLILGAVWAVWHLVPLLQAEHPPVWIAWWIVGTVAVRLLSFWIYNNGSSVLAAVLFHCMLNVSGFNYGPAYNLAAVGIIMMVSSALVTVLWGPRTLARYRYRPRPLANTR